MMEELIEDSQHELVDLVAAWRNASPSGRKELQSAMFPDGLVWSKESGFLNSRNEGLMDELAEFLQAVADPQKSLDDFIDQLGVPDGI